MIPAFYVAAATAAYIAFLFGIALYAEKRAAQGRSLTANPLVYTLSLTVFLTTWTFYGSIERAATLGVDFLTTYLGPTLIAFSWWYVVRKMVRISKENKIVSIADFISSRYGKSVSLGVVVTLLALFGITPYIALQLKAVAQTYDILTGPSTIWHHLHSRVPIVPENVDTALIVAIILCAFATLFGARHLNASERHEGLIAATASEGIVKLVAFLTVGLYITYGLFDGFIDVFARIHTITDDPSRFFTIGSGGTPNYIGWFSLLFLSMSAVVLLPRQFHMLVIENCSEDHIRDAMWRFPAYMFAITLFVMPIALGGMVFYKGNFGLPEYYTLQIPLDQGLHWLALFVFIGGFSAASGMAMVESVALATMILNHLIIPVLILRTGLRELDLSRVLVHIKRFGILLVFSLGYLFHRMIGDEFALIDIGLISFVAVTQFVPAMIGALYWKRANRIGVTVGLLLGFLVWGYTVVIPSLAQARWIDSHILLDGPFHIALLRPMALFGLSGLDIWSHALFWSFILNFGSFFAISLLTDAKPFEEEQAAHFVDVFTPQSRRIPLTRITQAPTVIEFVDLMAKFIGREQAEKAIGNYLINQEIDEKGKLADSDLPELKLFTERTLAAYVGAAPAHIIVENYMHARGSLMEDVFDIFGSVTLSRNSSREQLTVLYDVARAVGSGHSVSAVMDEVLNILNQQFHFDLTIVWIRDEEQNQLYAASRRESNYRQTLSETFLAAEPHLIEALQSNSVIIINDTDHLPGKNGVLTAEGISAFAYVPVDVDGDVVGILAVYAIGSKGIFTDDVRDLFESIAQQIGIAWRNDRLTDELIEVKEQEKELEIARNIQMELLPEKAPAIPGIELAGICTPASQIGGDYYDYLNRDACRFDLVIADVSGHNLGAALIIAETRAFIRAKAETLQHPAEIVCAVNNFFLQDLERAEMFITLFYTAYDSETRRLTYASAGHNIPFLYRAAENRCERLTVDGMILGIRPDVVYEEGCTRLEPGDFLLLYTDGLTEAENRAGEFFGEKRVEELLITCAPLGAREIIDCIMTAARAFNVTRTFRDDVTLVVLKCLESTDLAKECSNRKGSEEEI